MPFAISKHCVIEREIENTPQIRHPSISRAMTVFSQLDIGLPEPKIHLSNKMNRIAKIINTQTIPDKNNVPVESVIVLNKRASVLESIILPIPPITPNQPVISAIVAKMKKAKGPRINRANKTFKQPEPLLRLLDPQYVACAL